VPNGQKKNSMRGPKRGEQSEKKKRGGEGESGLKVLEQSAGTKKTREVLTQKASNLKKRG